MEIRKANDKDIEQIKLLLDRNFDEIMSKYHSKAILDKIKYHNSLESLTNQLSWKNVYVVEQDGAIIATGAFANFGSADNPKYSISNLYVMPELHLKGIGRFLFKQLLQDAKERKSDNFHVPSSRNAVTFYEKMGFIADEEQPEKNDEITWMTMRV